ncbi:tRNA guanosine(34) transglycosylase Tgt [Candidatus Dojkabacteria bacterium]|nr:tRNA guanosine(34) transglycosylase Tgt [Candidatus Dojkabacteria bacterium]
MQSNSNPDNYTTPREFGAEYIFLPDATNGAVRYISTATLEKIGIKGVVTNTLHLLILLGIDRMRNLGGMHKFMNWDRWLLSDSGGFQVFSLIHSGKWKGEITDNGAVFKSPRDGTEYQLTPESSIDIQMAIDSDILVVLDDCRAADITREEAEESVQNTINWAGRAKKHFETKYGGSKKSGKKLSCVVQGASFVDLREKCAKELVKIGFDGYNFGGYVVDANGELAVEPMRAVIENTPEDKFKYAMGVGKPQDILTAAKIGYKVFDTVLVTRNARHGSVYSFDELDTEGLLHIKNAAYGEDLDPIDSTCDCEACQNHSRAYFHNLLKAKEGVAYSLLSQHNLRFYQRLVDILNKNMEDVKECDFSDLIEKEQNK